MAMFQHQLIDALMELGRENLSIAGTIQSGFWSVTYFIGIRPEDPQQFVISHIAQDSFDPTNVRDGEFFISYDAITTLAELREELEEVLRRIY